MIYFRLLHPREPPKIYECSYHEKEALHLLSFKKMHSICTVLAPKNPFTSNGAVNVLHIISHVLASLPLEYCWCKPACNHHLFVHQAAPKLFMTLQLLAIFVLCWPLNPLSNQPAAHMTPMAS